MKDISRLFALFFAVLALTGCVRDDDEPISPTRPISRLYISTSDYQVNTSLTPYKNIFIVDPADDDSFETISTDYTSGVKGGAGILYSADMQRVLQASTNSASDPDTAVQVMTINKDNGILGQGGRVMSDLLTAVKGMAYHASTDYLFLVNSSATNNIYVYLRPTARNQPAKPTHTIPLSADFRPWSMLIRDISIDQNDRRNIAYMTTVGANGSVVGFNNLPNRLLNTNDSLVSGVTPDFTLTVTGSNNLLGMSYSAVLDMLVVTDYVNNEGRVLFFDKFSEQTTTGNITPSRTITGANTLLKTPVDIAIDSREGAKYLYVADRTDKSILRFLITDEGNVAPNARMEIKTGSFIHTPVGISLDARGTVQEDEE